MKNLIPSLNNEQKMSSREIAELTNKQHNNVLRDIKRQLFERIHGIKGNKIHESKIKGLTIVIDDYTKNTKEILLDRFHVYCLLIKIAPECMLKVIEKLGKSQDTLSDILQALESFDVSEFEDVADMFVYAIRESETGRIKLGISRDPHQRLKQLQTGNSQRLELVAYKKADNGFKDEKQLHQEAKNYHIRNEWFGSPALKFINKKPLSLVVSTDFSLKNAA